MYGDEETGMPPDQLYDKEDAREALQMAIYVYERARKLINTYC